MRLDKYLANMGIGSRKDVKKIILKGEVSVNGNVVRDPGFETGEKDNVISQGSRISYVKYVYLMMNKPSGVISATEDPRGEMVAKDLVREDFNFYELSCAGRLDKDAEGFLILTNDGDFNHRIISPKSNIDKVYFIRGEGEFYEDTEKRFKEGIVLSDGFKCLPADIQILSVFDNVSEALVRIHEGKFHQVKKMAAASGVKVTYLKRLSIGGVALDDTLLPGDYRELTREEMEILYEKTGY